MTSENASWRVLPHRPIEKLDDNLWRVDGDLPRGPIPRAMTLLRLADGRVVVYSAINVDDDTLRAIEAWGRPSILIVPSKMHTMDAPAWVARFPELRVVCPPGSRAAVEKKLKVHDTTADLGAEARFHVAGGTAEVEGWIEVRHGGRTSAVVCDLLMNLRPLRGVSGRLMGLLGFTGPRPKVAFLTRRLLIKERAGARAQLEAIAALPGLTRVVVAHGPPIEGDVAAAVRAAAADL